MAGPGIAGGGMAPPASRRARVNEEMVVVDKMRTWIIGAGRRGTATYAPARRPARRPGAGAAPRGAGTPGSGERDTSAPSPALQGRGEAFGYVCAALTVAIWCGFILMSRFGGTSGLSPYDVTALRLGTATLVLLPLWLWRRPTGVFSVRMAVLALLGGLGYALLVYGGFRYVPAAHAAVLLPGLLPFEIALFTWLVTGERPGRMRRLALGVASLAIENMASGTSMFGAMLMIAASLCWALYTVLARHWRVPPWPATLGVSLIAAAIYLPVYLALLPKQIGTVSWTVAAAQGFYQGVMAMIVAMILYLKAIEFLGTARTGSLMALVPAISGFLAVPVLGEAVSWWIAAGLLLVTAGAWLGNVGPRIFAKRIHVVGDHPHRA